MAAFVSLHFHGLVALLRDTGLSTCRRMAVSLLISGLVVQFAFYDPLASYARAFTTHGDAYYGQVVAAAGNLPGKVVCPEDPTIALLAKGYAGRSLFFEYDRLGWPVEAPLHVFDELDGADFVIQIKGDFQQLLSDDILLRKHFTMRERMIDETSVYVLWQRTAGAIE